MITVIKDFCFSSAHQLAKVHDGHKCKRLHGHNYRLRVECKGNLDEKDMVVDFFDIKKVVKPLVDALDHRNLNDVVGHNNTTSEWMCQWFIAQIKERMPSMPLSSVEVWETETCGARIDL